MSTEFILFVRLQDRLARLFNVIYEQYGHPLYLHTYPTDIDATTNARWIERRPIYIRTGKAINLSSIILTMKADKIASWLNKYIATSAPAETHDFID